MSYKLRFPVSRSQNGESSTEPRLQFKKKLEERLITPRVPSSALSGMPDCYKIKLRAAGYRLVYRVDEDVVFVTVISVGLRDKQRVYSKAHARLDEPEQD